MSGFNSLQIRTGNFSARTAKSINGTGTCGGFKSRAATFAEHSWHGIRDSDQHFPRKMLALLDVGRLVVQV
jgi:hypothetical protein